MSFFRRSKGKETSQHARKNYHAMKQNPFRYLSVKRVLWFFLPIIYGGCFVIAQLLIYLFEDVLPNLMQVINGQSTWYEIRRGLIRAIFDVDLTRYPLFYSLAFILATMLTIRLLFRFRTSFVPLEEQLTQGSMEWTNHKNLLDEYESVPVTPFAKDEDFFDGNVGFPVSRIPQNREEKATGKFRYSVDTHIGNALILASTRIGKSRYFINPFLDTITRAKDQRKRWSFVMTATKGIEPREWYSLLKKRGYNIRIYNTVNQFYSDPFPVLKTFQTFYSHYFEFASQAKAQEDVKQKQKFNIQAERQLTLAENALRRAAQAYFVEVAEGKDGGFWTKACRNLFMAIALAVADQSLREKESLKVNPYTIYNIANEMIIEKIDEQNFDFLKDVSEATGQSLHRLIVKYKGSSVLDVYFRELPQSHPARKYYAAILASAPAKVTLGNVLTHFDGDLESFLQSANAKMTSWDDGFDLESIGFDPDRPTAVFIIMSDSDEANNKLGMLIADQIYQVNKNRADLAEDTGNPHCVRPVVQIFDELGNLGVGVPFLDRKFTAGLSRWLYTYIVLQDTAQLSTLFSDSVRNTIMGNLANLVYIRSGSKETNEYVSEQLGKRSIYSRSRQKDPLSFKSTETESIERIALLEPYELSRLRDGESVVIRLNHGEDKHKNVIYQYPIFNSFENDTNMIKFDAFRELVPVSWAEVPVNNDFMAMDIADLLWQLHPIESNETKQALPKIPTKSKEQTEITEKPRKDQNSKGAKVSKLMKINEAHNEVQEKQEKEIAWKIQLADQYQMYFEKEYDKPVSVSFNDLQRKQLKKIVEGQFVDKPIIVNEYRRLMEIQDQSIASLCVFLISNCTKETNQHLFDQLVKMKEGRS
ncbi:type IV secretory system conjugative DNA transfer family protein [Enterococcus casseliflavus]|uniref:type IV secretory system conjugative DNA transfer family protein n=1 Tax=Enterococcus casseliflavus TaxID=37734 RepID=UPI0034D25DD7